MESVKRVLGVSTACEDCADYIDANLRTLCRKNEYENVLRLARRHHQRTGHMVRVFDTTERIYMA